MASGLEAEQSNLSVQEDDTLTPSNKSQTTSLSGSTSGMERSESGLSLADKLRRSSSSGHFTARSPVLSPQSEGQTGLADPLGPDQDSWDHKVSETETGTSESGQCVVFIDELSLCLRCKVFEFCFFRCWGKRGGAVLWTTEGRIPPQLQQAGFSTEHHWGHSAPLPGLHLQLFFWTAEGAAGTSQLQSPTQGHLLQVTERNQLPFTVADSINLHFKVGVEMWVCDLMPLLRFITTLNQQVGLEAHCGCQISGKFSENLENLGQSPVSISTAAWWPGFSSFKCCLYLIPMVLEGYALWTIGPYRLLSSFDSLMRIAMKFWIKSCSAPDLWL